MTPLTRHNATLATGRGAGWWRRHAQTIGRDLRTIRDLRTRTLPVEHEQVFWRSPPTRGPLKT